jgi:uncharacterized protein YrrD
MVFHLYLTCQNAQTASNIRQHVTFQEICKKFPISSDNVVIEIVDEQQSVSHQRLLKELINKKANKGDKNRVGIVFDSLFLFLFRRAILGAYLTDFLVVTQI